MGKEKGVSIIKVDYRDEDRSVPENYFIHEPSADDLMPGAREKEAMRRLLEWQESSRKVRWVVGEPVGI